MNERRSKCMQTHVNIQQRGGRPSGKDCVILLVVCQLIVSFLVSVLIGRVRKSRCVREKCSPSYLFSGGHASSRRPYCGPLVVKPTRTARPSVPAADSGRSTRPSPRLPVNPTGCKMRKEKLNKRAYPYCCVSEAVLLFQP
jgi:hypothetical protein